MLSLWSLSTVKHGSFLFAYFLVQMKILEKHMHALWLHVSFQRICDRGPITENGQGLIFRHLEWQKEICMCSSVLDAQEEVACTFTEFQTILSQKVMWL